MGRYVRSVLRDLAANPRVELILLVRDARNAADYHELIGNVEVDGLKAARARTDLSLVWYPWNGMRFASRAPAVVTINDDFAFAYPAAGLVARHREQEPIRRAAARAAAVGTISAWARTALIERFALEPSRVSVFPLAPDPAFVPGAATSPYAEPFVLAVGTREKRKNIDFLIEVFARAFPDRDVRLVLVGELDPPQRRRSAAAGVVFNELIDVTDAELIRLYRTAAAVAVPSLAEGFGLVAAEAQACGAAVIAANTTALPEAVGDAGVLADPRDVTAWTPALRNLVRDAALNAYYRAAGAARWPPRSRERTTDAVLALFERAVDDRA